MDCVNWKWSESAHSGLLWYFLDWLHYIISSVQYVYSHCTFLSLRYYYICKHSLPPWSLEGYWNSEAANFGKKNRLSLWLHRGRINHLTDHVLVM